MKYNCHINVKSCASVRSVKYLNKYVYKGTDRAQVEVAAVAGGGAQQQAAGEAPPAAAAAPANAAAAAAPAAAPAPAAGAAAEVVAADDPRVIDEIKSFLDGRYISASEAHWRMISFSMHQESPNVVRLAVHLPGSQQVLFRDGDDLARLAQRPPPNTTLLAWFAYNRQHPGSDVLYPDFPSQHTFDKQQRVWRPRRRQMQRQPIGRMYFVHPGEGERYYLRLLLNHVPGATSFEHLRSVGEQHFPTFQAAALARGLLASDSEWDACLGEADSHQMPVQMREMFAVLLLFNGPADPWALWCRHKTALCEDLLRDARTAAHDPSIPLSTEMEDEALRRVQDILQRQGKTLHDFPPMRVPPPRPVPLGGPPPLVAEHLRYDRDALAQRVAAQLSQLTAEQHNIYNTVMAAVSGGVGAMNAAGRSSNLFFVDAPGGCGKTFTFNILLAAVHGDGQVALAVASSGIAALLMDSGSTAHSRTKIPINLSAESTCNIPVQSDLAELMVRAALIVWDEAPMMHKFALEALDRTLRDVMGSRDPALRDVPFGGKTIVLGGDFRQVLPVVPKGGRGVIVSACLKNSRLWAACTTKRLSVNMRVAMLAGADAARQQEWADHLLAVGDGRAGELMRIADDMFLPTDRPSDLLHAVFGWRSCCTCT